LIRVDCIVLFEGKKQQIERNRRRVVGGVRSTAVTAGERRE